MDTRKLCTGISPNFVSNWTVVEGLREVIQNYLDASIGVDERQITKGQITKGQITYKDGYAEFRDYGPGLEPRHLALGITEKIRGPGNKNPIGQFGKGLKQAMLVFAREGLEVTVVSNGMRIIPAIEFNPDYETEVMILNITQASTPITVGTLVRVECSEEDLETAKNYYEVYRDIRWLIDGKLSEPGGDVYINGCMVGKLGPALFSYHLTMSETETLDVLSSERDMVNIDKIRPLVARVIEECSSKEAISKFLKNEIDPGIDNDDLLFESRIQISCSDMCKKQIKVWRDTFYEINGPNAVLHDLFAPKANIEYLGYNLIRTRYTIRMFLMGCGVKTSKDIVSPPEDIIKVADNLTGDEKDTLKSLIKTVTHYYRDPETVLIADNLDEAYNCPRYLINGLYSVKNDIIYLRREILENYNEALNTLLHETVHKVSMFGDLTPEFEHALCQASVDIIVKCESQIARE